MAHISGLKDSIWVPVVLGQLDGSHFVQHRLRIAIDQVDVKDATFSWGLSTYATAARWEGKSS